ncbi:hypothetical protein BCR36DRAFT_313396, partial [Piromyces finnis]
YLPKCSISCNTGECVNMNTCDCSKTKFRGPYCNEYYKAKKVTWFNITIIIISIILTLITLFCMLGICLNRNAPKIKAASYNFLLIILVGIIFNNIYLIFLTTSENTIKTCTHIYLFNNLGFSLIYGSIFVKTLRIYIINNKNAYIKKDKILYIILMTILLYHLFTTSIWIVSDNIKVNHKYTINSEEYTACEYPLWSKLSTILNLSLLFIDISLSYVNRNINKKFRESLSTPVYVYVISSIFMDIINIDYGAKQYIFDACLMIINTIVILYFIFISKYFKIFYSYFNGSKEITSKSTLVITTNDLFGKSNGSRSFHN